MKTTTRERSSVNLLLQNTIRVPSSLGPSLRFSAWHYYRIMGLDCCNCRRAREEHGEDNSHRVVFGHWKQSEILTISFPSISIIVCVFCECDWSFLLSAKHLSIWLNRVIHSPSHNPNRNRKKRTIPNNRWCQKMGRFHAVQRETKGVDPW